MSEALIYSLAVGVSVGLSAGYLGSLMVLEKMALVGDALSHVALPGLALGILWNFNPLVGAFVFLFASAVLTWQLGRITKLSFETIVGALFTLSLAVGILLIPDVEVLADALFGDITAVTAVDTVVALTLAAVAIVLTRMIYKKIVLGMISEELAISHGINVERINLLYLLLVSLVVAVGIKIVGTLLVGFLVIVPAGTAKNLSSSLHRYALLSSVLGAVSAFSGILLAGIFDLPAGPLVVLAGVAVFVVAVVAKALSEA